MKLQVPEYYKDFKCVGGSCTDNCCIGWEIDIDDKTKEKYLSLNTHLGKKIRENTVAEDGAFHFVLQGERCPFLNSDNLCDIICEMGEECLCDICREHPRYYTTLFDTVFGGVGLACEEAAKLILTSPLPHRYITLETEGEREECDEELLEIFLGLRERICEIFGEKTQSIVYLVEEVEKAVLSAQARADAEPGKPYKSRVVSHKTIVENVENCELLSQELPELLKRATRPKNGISKNQNINHYLQNLYLYVLDRYLPKAVEDGNFLGKAALARFSLETLKCLFEAEEELTLTRAIYLAKLYSREIEYNEDNTALLEDF